MSDKLDIEIINGMVFPKNFSHEKGEQTWAIELSNKIIVYLKSKVHSHNKAHPESKTNIIQLKKVFVNAPYEKNSNIIPRGIAYVNNFLKLKRNEWQKDLYDESLNLLLSDEETRTAQKELEGTNLHNLYASSTGELYIENREKTKTIHWFEV